jgi:uncharacterized protein YndB with AHSA1/START domain
MPPVLVSRRSLTVGFAALPAAFAVSAQARADSDDPGAAKPDAADGLSHSAAAIHQEVLFKASRQRVYRLLTDAREFDAVTRLSDAVTLVTAPNAKATTISTHVGGSFTLFGGYITGRHLEMVPNDCLVQAWRAGSWSAGEYSIVNFTLQEGGEGCRLVFNHRGFPDSHGSSLASGWRVHYWDPMTKRLAQSA